MSLRKAVVFLVVLVTPVLFHRMVVIPYRCNLVEGRASRATDAIWSIRDSFQARKTASRNVDILTACPESCKRSVNLLMLTGTNLAILGRHEASLRLFEEALRLDRRPELYQALGLAQLKTGRRDAALESFVKAGEFSGLHALSDIPDGEIRWKAYAIVGSRHEAHLRAKGEFDTRSRITNGGFESGDPAVLSGVVTATRGSLPSPASDWELDSHDSEASGQLVQSPRHSGARAIHVLASPGGGLRQVWRSRATPRARTVAWVFVRSGRVFLSTNDEIPSTGAISTTTGRWERLETINSVCPATVTAIYAHGTEAADFYVDDVSAELTLSGSPCQ